MDKISISYEISGIIKTKLKKRKDEILLSADTDLKNFLIKYCGISLRYLKYLDVTVNGKHEKDEYILKNNDKVIILMPIGGG